MSGLSVTGDWIFCLDHDAPGRVVARETFWGRETCRVWLPHRDVVVTVPLDRLAPLSYARIASEHPIGFACAGSRIADALQQDALVAPLEASIIPLPHQLDVLQRAMAGDKVRYMLADEVGLGKTIEAGLILREMKTRGLVKRILVVSPAGLVTQWVSEMKNRFREKFQLVQPGSFGAWRKLASIDDHENLWRLHDHVVCPMDSVKPIEARKGWSIDQQEQYNREHFIDLVSAGWDLIIVDEAHRLTGATDGVARYRLGEALAQASPYLLLLTATPHQGKTEAFRRLIRLLDARALPNPERVSREDVAPYVIRTEKRHAVDADGNPLFKPRQTQLIPVGWEEGRQEQRALYEAVTHYVRHVYDQAVREKRNALGFLMILMQRLVTSSTAAIRTALERRLQVLEMPPTQLSLFPDVSEEDWAALDGQSRLDALLTTRLRGLKDERKQVELLLSSARRCEALGPDAKAEELLRRIRRLQADENDPNLKVLVFTEFVPTQAMLSQFLEERGFPVVCLNGSMDLEERREAQEAFAGPKQILVSTDAGGEGLNLQFCHVVVNFDLPWNPMRLEQRIGRLDRIGQAHVVRALNLALEQSVEYRVREVLEEKLARILEEFGVDKLADVLDSEEDIDFDGLYVGAVLDPAMAAKRAEAMAREIREKCLASREAARLLESGTRLDPAAAKRFEDHPIGLWIERMTTSYLCWRQASGATAQKEDCAWKLRFPDGTEVHRAVFSMKEPVPPGGNLLTLEDPRVRGLLTQVPLFAPGQPLASVVVSGISDKTSGIWSLWRICLRRQGEGALRCLPIFIDDEGRERLPTARLLWDRMSEPGTQCRVLPKALEGDAALGAYETSRKAAEEQGCGVFEELHKRHHDMLGRERRNAKQSFEARRRAIGRLGLPQVRGHRLEQLAREERENELVLVARELVMPDMTAVIMFRVCSQSEAT